MALDTLQNYRTDRTPGKSASAPLNLTETQMNEEPLLSRELDALFDRVGLYALAIIVLYFGFHVACFFFVAGGVAR